jgi:hypothetical protein
MMPEPTQSRHSRQGLNWTGALLALAVFATGAFEASRAIAQSRGPQSVAPSACRARSSTFPRARR